MKTMLYDRCDPSELQRGNKLLSGWNSHVVTYITTTKKLPNIAPINTMNLINPHIISSYPAFLRFLEYFSENMKLKLNGQLNTSKMVLTLGMECEQQFYILKWLINHLALNK